MNETESNGVWEVETKFLIPDSSKDVLIENLNKSFRRIAASKDLVHNWNLLFDDKHRSMRDNGEIFRVRFNSKPPNSFISATRKSPDINLNLSKFHRIMIREEKEAIMKCSFVSFLEIIKILNLMDWEEYFRYVSIAIGKWISENYFAREMKSKNYVEVVIREYPTIGLVLELEMKAQTKEEAFALRPEIMFWAEKLGLSPKKTVKMDMHRLYKSWCKANNVEFKNQFVFEEAKE